ncbi:unnamed protein product [Schistocephalus solidus]|uniref:Uncharacterized protein n=1 Tax=Schistocephalus solidus TaxID=70667 RepID=A0A3P7DAQ4_SCHSO|nr:unnamed protein product [Schistocephalus solidus]
MLGLPACLQSPDEALRTPLVDEEELVEDEASLLRNEALALARNSLKQFSATSPYVPRIVEGVSRAIEATVRKVRGFGKYVWRRLGRSLEWHKKMD